MSPDDIEAMQTRLRERFGLPDLTVVYRPPTIEPKWPYHTITTRWQQGEKTMQVAYQWHADQHERAEAWMTEALSGRAG